MKKAFLAFLIFTMSFGAAPRAMAASISFGDLIKASTPAVYYYGADGKRYVFPNEKTYSTWYADFSGVKTVSDAELAAIQIGGNATYKPGVKMVKITTDPKVYAVGKGGDLRWVKTEDAAASLYSADWNKKIDDIPDAFFTNYSIGAEIATASDFNVDNEKNSATSINTDKNLAAAPAPKPPPSAPSYVWNQKTANGDGYFHKNLTLTSYGSKYLATWHDDRNGQNEIYYQKLGADGAGAGDAQRASSNITDSTGGKSIYDGINMYFMWEDSSPLKRAIYLQKHDADGNKLSLRVFASSTYATSKNPDFDWNAALDEYGAVWWDTRSTLSGSVGDIYFSKMSSGLKIGAELRITDGMVLETKPAIAGADNKFAVVWQDGDNYIKFVFVDKNSAKYGTIKNVVLAPANSEPRVAWSGSNFAVSWADSDGVYFMLLDKDGSAIGEKKLLDSGGISPDIVWSGNKFYAAYAKNNDIYIAKIAINGNISATGENISNTTAVSSLPKLAVNNSGNIAAAWIENDGAVNKILSAVETKQ